LNTERPSSIIVDEGRSVFRLNFFLFPSLAQAQCNANAIKRELPALTLTFILLEPAAVPVSLPHAEGVAPMLWPSAGYKNKSSNQENGRRDVHAPPILFSRVVSPRRPP
jgi:hypothetical protein